SATQINFIGMRRIAAGASLIVIAVGVVAIVARGADIFDIDFRGGTSVHLKLSSPAETEAVRGVLTKQFNSMGVAFTLTGMANTPGGTTDIFKVDSGLPEVEALEAAIQQAFREGGGGLSLATYSLTHGEIRATEIAAPGSKPESPTKESGEAETKPEPDDASTEPAASQPDENADAREEKPAAPASAKPKKAENETAKENAEEKGAPEKPQAKPPEKPDGAQTLADTGDLLAMADGFSWRIAQADPSQEKIPPAEPPETDPPTAEKKPAAVVEKPAETAAEVTHDDDMSDLTDAASETAGEGSEGPRSEDAVADAAAPAPSTMLEVPLSFEYGINRDTLFAEIDDARQQLDLPPLHYDLINPDWQGGSNLFKEWTLRIATDEATANGLLDHLSKGFSGTPVWPSSSKIGGQVAGRMQQKAIMALLTSLLGIVVYIWIRFQRVVFGLAAVVALIHDVLVTLGAIAISAWLAGALGFLLIEEFKISLPIVAALLTIIGYSLNDTIVVFDRIREVRGKSPNLTSEMINASINQTLGRTLLTSLTTLVVVAILYAIGGEGIHGFAFSLVVGVIVGTYSSIFVASPVLLWMAGGDETRRGKPAA
ncbi:MAG: protein translocase subunit SecF, partial [Pirellulaceae bacterium]